MGQAHGMQNEPSPREDRRKALWRISNTTSQLLR